MEENERIQRVDIETQMKQAYIDYAMSVIVARALPDARDGMKPVQRRIMFAMGDMGMTYNTKHKKSARIVGEVLGKYHPHGDSSVYLAMVRMAQKWALRYPLVDGQGNFGSIDLDPPAAMRYTEARMSRIASELLSDIDKDTVDFQNNFDDSLREPTVLPTKVPTLLVNGTNGIAVGMATNMAPHNLSESIDGIVAYIDNNDISIDELMHYIKAPDFPTGGINYGFYFGVTNSNIDDCLKIDNSICAGLKLFLGSSTGNMLVDNRQSIEYLFQNAKKIISAHCEDESLIKENKVKYLSIEPLPYNIHSLIRNADVCYNSSSYAVSLAKKYHTN